MGNDMFNDEQLAHLKDRADETERLRLALAEATREAERQRSDAVRFHGLLATAERERDEARKRWAFWEESAAMLRLVNEDYIRKNVALVNDLTAEIRRAEALRATAPHVNPGDGAVREAAERCVHAATTRDRGEAIADLSAALSSPPRPETKDDALHATPESERACAVCDTDVCEHIAARLAPPADAATEAVREAAKIVRDILTAFEARITSQGMLTWSQPDTPTGFVPAILWLERLALAPAPKPAICHGCTGEVEAHPYGQWPCDNHPLRRSAHAPAPSAKEGR